jgi:magnesium transporter
MKKILDVISKDYVTLLEGMDVKEAMKKVISTSTDETLIDVLYIVDSKNKLLGILDLKDLIIARSPMKIREIMNVKYHYISEFDSITKAIGTIQDYDRDMIPVLSKSKTILGIFTAEMALNMLADETLEDYHRLASLSEYDVHSKPISRSKKRLPWLIILLGLSLITASVLSIFESTIQSVILLVLFQPMILDSAGNISTQSLAKTILVMNEDPDAKLTKFIKKELLVGFINSVIVSLAGFLFSLLFLYVFENGFTEPNLQISIIVSMTLLVALLVGALTGAFIPVILKRMNVDPSVASGPFMTTLNDVISLLIYFSLATIFLV